MKLKGKLLSNSAVTISFFSILLVYILLRTNNISDSIFSLKKNNAKIEEVIELVDNLKNRVVIVFDTANKLLKVLEKTNNAFVSAVVDDDPSYLEGLKDYEYEFINLTNILIGKLTQDDVKKVILIKTKYLRYVLNGKNMVNDLFNSEGKNINLSSISKDAEELNRSINSFHQAKKKEFFMSLKKIKSRSLLFKEDVTNVTSTIDSDVKSLFLIVLSATIAGIIIIVVLTIIFTKSITGPLSKVVFALKEIEQGHIKDRLSTNTNDEIGEIAKAMNAFSDNLEFKVVDSIQKLANGNLTFDIKPMNDSDIIGNSLKKTGDDLNYIISNVNGTIIKISSDASKIAKATNSLSLAVNEQASAVEEITSSLEEVGAQTATNADNANHANKLAKSASHSAENGKKQMSEMTTAMIEINKSGEDISKIIKVIDEIAFQTNLLALNAAVEAARAGSHGKGFAVVAEEVRDLAARSANAAKETEELIETSVKKAKNGVQISKKMSVALDEVVGGVEKVTNLIEEIALASNEQSKGISQINQAMDQIDRVTQKNSHEIELSASAVRQLAQESDKLKGMMAIFQIRGGASPIKTVENSSSNDMRRLTG